MATVDAGSSGSRRMVHTETRSPFEVVFGRVVYYVFGVIDALIAVRFLLRLLAANRDTGFVSFIYSVSAFFMAPFEAVFKTQTAAGAAFEGSALLALAVYALIAWGIVTLVRAVSPRRSSETVERVEKTEDTKIQQ